MIDMFEKNICKISFFLNSHFNKKCSMNIVPTQKIIYFRKNKFCFVKKLSPILFCLLYTGTIRLKKSVEISRIVGESKFKFIVNILVNLIHTRVVGRLTKKKQPP